MEPFPDWSRVAFFTPFILIVAALTANAQLTAMPSAQDDAPLADQAATDIKDVKPSGPRKFKRVWTFAGARDEDFVRKLAALNVQNVGAKTPEKVALAKKYGMLPNIGAGAAAGTHRQVMTAAETNALHALNGEPPPSSRGNWCEQKTAADVERELNDLLDAAAGEICAFEMTAIVDDPELYAVFL